MKLLKNIGIYYVVLFLVSVGLTFIIGILVFMVSIPIFALGVLFLVLYFVFKKNNVQLEFSKTQLNGLTLFFSILPFLTYAFVDWYITRPYKQTIILPNGYEGVVAIQYDKPEGQEKKRTGSFLGIGGSRLIQVDTTGIAKTQFTFHNNSIPFLGMEQYYYNEGGLKIYYENDLDHEIIEGFDGIRSGTLEDSIKGKKNIYITGFNYYPLMIFVITKPENYYHYFKTKKQIEDWIRQQQKKYPRSYIEKPRNELNSNFDYYYELKEYYYNK